jgi:DNA-directed RNA polymerase specialized sigma24 family protein
MSGPRRDASGDRLADLYDRFAATLFRHDAMLLADRATAAAVVQNVFLKLTKAGWRARPIGRPKGWLVNKRCKICQPNNVR